LVLKHTEDWTDLAHCGLPISLAAQAIFFALAAGYHDDIVYWIGMAGQTAIDGQACASAIKVAHRHRRRANFN
jgi:hypothetical protein